jgi:hypothetical protein
VHRRSTPAASRGLFRSALLLEAALSATCLAGVSRAEGTEAPADSQARPIRLADVPAGARARLPPQALSAAGFSSYIAALDAETAAREREGEYEHLVYYVLQSQRFTREPRLEPAASAHAVVRGLAGPARERFLDGADAGAAVPPAVARRIAGFLEAAAGTPVDPRLRHFRGFLNANAAVAPEEQLRAAYLRVMRFLYKKEFVGRELRDPQAAEEFLAELYRKRGHSTDTQIEANFAVHTALSVVRELEPTRLLRVLLIGPGLDFAPRTGLVDLFEPQSYQPFALADSLLALGLARREELRVHCVDINERVVAYLQNASKLSAPTLRVLSGVAERAERRFTDDYRAYFRRLGERIAVERPLAVPGEFAAHLRKTLELKPEIAARVTAERLNVVTQRRDSSPGYDLAVITNVFGYFDPVQQALALANLEAMLRPGGYLIHNDPQTLLVETAESLGLGLVHARTVLIAQGEPHSLFDRIAIHRKAPQAGAAER